jgi:hypothetical protein
MAPGNPLDQGDLKRVKGIGPKVEERLKGAGITTLAQLARTPVNELAAILEGLRGKYDADRITRDKWLSQAATLAAAPAAAPAEAEPAERVRHHFTVEVQLAIPGREIVSSKVTHVETGDQATWAAWDGQRIVAFVEDRSGARRSVPAAVEVETRTGAEPAPIAGPGDAGEVTGLALHTFDMVLASGPEVTMSGPITATLSFDAATVDLPTDQAAQAKIDVYARRPPPAKSLRVGSAVADISPGGLVRIQIPCDLPRTAYPVSLFATVLLFAATAVGRPPLSVLPEASLTVPTASAEVPGNAVHGLPRPPSRADRVA